MFKKSIDTKGVSWDERLLALTHERLLISKVGERRVLDYVYMKVW